MPFLLLNYGLRHFHRSLLLWGVFDDSWLEGKIVQSRSQCENSLLLSVKKIPLVIKERLEIVPHLDTRRHSQQCSDLLLIEFSYLALGKRGGLAGLWFWVYLWLECAVDMVIHASEIGFFVP